MKGQPLLIRIDGPIASGKTTAKWIIAHALKQHGFDVSSDMEPDDSLLASFDKMIPIVDVLAKGGTPDPLKRL